MREILFRGKRKDNGEWVYGNYAYTDSDGKHHYIFQNIPFEHEVIPETVGQYTGLTDKNGKKIFENDVVKCNDEANNAEFTAFVKFGNPNGEYNWGYQLNFIAGDTATLDILLWVEMEEEGAYIEVIGNIHDNPELLKGEENV